ncbi:hypothetical protein BIW11_08432, partial [Tropilaelaps mercedesae]
KINLQYLRSHLRFNTISIISKKPQNSTSVAVIIDRQYKAIFV